VATAGHPEVERALTCSTASDRPEVVLGGLPDFGRRLAQPAHDEFASHRPHDWLITVPLAATQARADLYCFLHARNRA
jgi:hypothetical protein